MVKTLNRVLIYFLGLVILCLGVVLNTKTNLGVAAINAIPFVVSKSTSLSLGTCVFVLYIVFILMQFLVNKKIDLLTILQLPVSLLFGRMVDIVNIYILKFEAHNIFGGLIMLVIAILLVGLGTTLVISQNLIPNAPDGMVNALGKLFNKPFGYIKVRFDIICVCLALIISFLMTGKIVGIGLGTLISMLLTGNVCNFFKKVLNNTLITK